MLTKGTKVNNNKFGTCFFYMEKHIELLTESTILLFKKYGDTNQCNLLLESLNNCKQACVECNKKMDINCCECNKLIHGECNTYICSFCGKKVCKSCIKMSGKYQRCIQCHKNERICIDCNKEMDINCKECNKIICNTCDVYLCLYCPKRICGPCAIFTSKGEICQPCYPNYLISRSVNKKERSCFF